MNYHLSRVDNEMSIDINYRADFVSFLHKIADDVPYTFVWIDLLCKININGRMHSTQLPHLKPELYLVTHRNSRVRRSAIFSGQHWCTSKYK